MNAVRLAEINIGERVAVIGLGIVGQLVAQLVRCQGGVVIAIDLDKRRVDLAQETGADFGITASDTTVKEVLAVDRRTRRGLCDCCGGFRFGKTFAGRRFDVRGSAAEL